MLQLNACSSEEGATLVIVPNSVESSDNTATNVNAADANSVSDSALSTNDASLSNANEVASNQPSLESSPGAAAITEVVLVTGQSNALGSGTLFDAERDTPHPRAFAYTQSGWQVADLHQVWDQGWHPRNDPNTDPSNNFGFHFARKVAARRPDRVIGFILVTAPGAGISHWDYESDFYMQIRDRVVAAINELPNKSSIDGILWHQGETDWRDSDYYSAKLDDLIRNFRGESWFGDNRPFICGETVQAPVNNRLMALNNDGNPWTGCVEANGLPTILDDLHFSAEGLRIIGTRYATKYLQMTEQP